MASTDDDAIMARFVADYLALLDQRIGTIQAHLDVGNDTTAQVAMLSLESTSTMVGAVELAQIVADLRAGLERGDRTRFTELNRAMVAAAARVPASLGRS